MAVEEEGEGVLDVVRKLATEPQADILYLMTSLSGHREFSNLYVNQEFELRIKFDCFEIIKKVYLTGHIIYIMFSRIG